ncbi:MAG: hypothetical protein KAJ17_12350 [Candidatus Krumholzibacteria bacterium]|nr:hypothetical protein [Candidatus Krumholzibacteria bacterium]
MAILTEEDRLSYRIVFLIAVVGLLAVPVTGLRLAAALVILCYLPAAPFAARAGLPFFSAIALIVTVSPLLIALPVMAVMLLGLPVETAVWAIVGISMAQFLTYGTQRALSATTADKRLLIGLAAVVAVAAVLTLWLPATNTWWQFREDSWFHAAVFRRIANYGLPAVDPYFSPLRLQYMYFYHILLLIVSTLTGLGPFGAMIFTNFIALGGCVLGFNFLAGMFTQRSAVRLTGVILCMFAMNGLFYLFFPLRLVRAFWGEMAGSDVLQQFYSLSPLGQATVSRFVSVEGNQHLFLDKFMLGTALSLTLGLVCALLALMLLAHRGRWTWVHSFFYMAVLSGAMFLHLVVGVTIAAATVGTIIVTAVVRPRIRSPEDEGGLALRWQAFLAIFSIVIVIPYMMSVTPHGGPGRSVAIGIQFRQVFGVLSCLLPALIPALWYLVRVERARRPDAAGDGLSSSGVLAVWTVFVLAIALVVDLPTSNETKFVFPLYIALSALAVGALDRWTTAQSGRSGRSRWSWVVAYVVLCTVPLNALYFAGAFADRSKFNRTLSEISLYDWIRKTTRDEALFLEADDIVRIPVLAGRDQYWGTEAYAHIWGYPPDEIEARRSLRDAIFGEKELTDDLLEHAAALRRPFYVVLRNIHADGGKKFKRLADDPRLTGKFMYENIAVFELNFSRLKSASSVGL